MSSDLRGNVARMYAAEAQAYNDLWASVLNPIALELVSTVPQSRRVLDVATGTGTLLPDLRDRLSAELIVGLDLTPEMVALADPSFGRIVGDASALPFGHESFDLVVLAFVLFHLDDPGVALAEANRVLVSDGWVGTVTWQSDSGNDASLAWNAELDRFGAPPLESNANPEQVNSPEKMERLLASAGFEDVRSWTLVSGEQIAPEVFIARRARLGVPCRRLASLDAGTRAACFDAACSRVRSMQPDAFRSEWVLVLATGRARSASG